MRGVPRRAGYGEPGRFSNSTNTHALEGHVTATSQPLPAMFTTVPEEHIWILIKVVVELTKLVASRWEQGVPKHLPKVQEDPASGGQGWNQDVQSGDGASEKLGLENNLFITLRILNRTD